jgi:uncharacterized protein (TIGR02594 family)
VEITAYDLAQRFVGVKEVSGPTANPQILAMLQLDNAWPQDDSVAWCSAFANYVAWLLRLPRSKDLRARSWLLVGTPVKLEDAQPGFDVVIFSREGSTSDPTVIDAPGHVAFYAGRDDMDRVLALGGNQGDCVCVEAFSATKVLGIRRLL